MQKLGERGFLLEEQMILALQGNQPCAGYSGSHASTRIEGDTRIVTGMQDERWHADRGLE